MMSYLAERDSVPVGEMAAQFGVSEAQVLKDVDLLWVAGLPGYFPDDLIDFAPDDYAANIISLREPQGLGRPVPLAPREALALTAAVEWLRGSGVADTRMRAVLDRVQAKLHGVAPAQLAVEAAAGGAARAAISRALAAREQLQIEYVSAEDRTSLRVITPRALYSDGAAWYLDAWCELAGGERTFRVDRILGFTPVPGRAPAPVPDADAAPSSPAQSAPSAQSAPLDVVLVLARRARWVAEDLPDAVLTDVSVDGQPCVAVRLAITRTDWLIRLLLSVGADVVSVSPPQLQDQLLSRAAAALAAYREHTDR